MYKERLVLLLLLFITIKITWSNEKYIDKKLLCSTKNYGIKGGFIFDSDNLVQRLNILYNSENKKEYIKVTKHCYLDTDTIIAISRNGNKNNCGPYDSFIDKHSLDYVMPQNNLLLTATCKYFDGDIEEILIKKTQQ